MPYAGKRITFTEKGKVELLDRTQDAPGPGQVIIETLRTAVSPGTELSRLYDFHMAPKPFPQNTGYLSLGRVIELGANVKNVKIGEVYITGFGHLSHMAWDADKLVPIPTGVSLDEAVLAPLANVAMQGIRRAHVKLGDSVLVMGMGLIGQFTQILARIDGGMPVVGVDLSERRLELARKTGLANALNPKAPDFEAQLKKLTPNGQFRVSIDSTGTPFILPTLFERTADEGTVVVLGGVHKKVEVDLYTHFQKRSLRMVGAGGLGPALFPHGGAQENTLLILNLIASGQFKIQPLLTHVVPVAEAPAMYRMLQEEKDKAMGVVFKWKD